MVPAARVAHEGPVRPLVGAGKPVLVDDHAICSDCGTAVQLVGPDRWRHARPGRPSGRSRWLSPVTLPALRQLATYEQFKARFPWAARADLGGPFVTSEDQWREARRRLEEYHAILASVRREPALRHGKNPYLELFGILAAPPAPSGLTQVLHLRQRRRELAALFSWAIPTNEALDVLARYAPLVECGAGMGYWTALLQARGVDAIACDAEPPGGAAANEYHGSRRKPWVAVERICSAAAVRRHRPRTLFLCWPPHDDDAASYAVLRAYRGAVMIYVGEPDDGATGSLRFHRELRLNWSVTAEVELPHWPAVRDRLVVYRRNAVRQPHRDRDRCFECQRFIRTGAIGRCDPCFERRPPAIAVKVGTHRVEYPPAAVAAMPPALRSALENSPNRIR
jgi:hypothetical protein